MKKKLSVPSACDNRIAALKSDSPEMHVILDHIAILFLCFNTCYQIQVILYNGCTCIMSNSHYSEA